MSSLAQEGLYAFMPTNMKPNLNSSVSLGRWVYYVHYSNLSGYEARAGHPPIGKDRLRPFQNVEQPCRGLARASGLYSIAWASDQQTLDSSEVRYHGAR